MKNSTRLFVVGLACVLLSAYSASTVRAQVVSEEEESKFSMDVTLNSDIFFGFYPFFAGSYEVNPKFDFTFYGILWSGGTGGFAAGWGNWTEFGVGIGLPVGDNLYINPQIGLLSGSLTSGGGTPVLGEGIVPNLTVGLDTDIVEGELYAGYYLGFDHGNPATSNFLHWWLNSGYKVNSFLSLGLHFEQLRFTGGQGVNENADAFDFYVALGPYIQFSNPKGPGFARFSSGWDLRDKDSVDVEEWEQPSFFKLTVGYSF
ncbi:MAG: hypothetical protein JJU23_08190 [Cyclobacteriaceae bacterium]|nr:hypothetical protein [Cyclobacteriaceae bacterium]